MSDPKDRTAIYLDGDILLAGDMRDLFADIKTAGEGSFEIHENILDAIDAAGEDRFKTIVVGISDTSSKMTSILKAFRSVSSARIILLAKMYQEPIAIKLVSKNADNTSLADDYLIYPVDVQLLYGKRSSLDASSDAEKPVILSVAAPVESPEIRQQARIRELEYLATTDELTGLKNRRYTLEFCRQIIEYAEKNNDQVTLLFFDIDDFKHYNDVYSHRVGDAILKEAASLMKRCCRPHDVVGRIGGDEFAVIFWHMPKEAINPERTERRSNDSDHPKEAIIVANRLMDELQKADFSYLGPQGRGVLTVSGGLACFPRDGGTVEQLLDSADKALLDAKRHGKNRIYLVGQPDGDISDM